MLKEVNRLSRYNYLHYYVDECIICMFALVLWLLDNFYL